jgi:hypothetical protein
VTVTLAMMSLRSIVLDVYQIKEGVRVTKNLVSASMDSLGNTAL